MEQDHPLSGLLTTIMQTFMPGIKAALDTLQDKTTLQLSPEEEKQAPWYHEPPLELEAEIVRWLSQQQEWRAFPGHAGWIIARCEQHPDHVRLRAALEHLYNCFGNRLGTLAAEMYCSPYHWLQRHRHNWIYCVSMFKIITAALASYPPDDILTRIEARISKVLDYLLSGQQADAFDEMHFMVLEPFGSLQTWAGSVQACLNILISLPPSQEAQKLGARLRAMTYAGPSPTGGLAHSSLYGIAHSSLLRALAQLYRYGKLDYAVFWQCAQLIPECLMDISVHESNQWGVPVSSREALQAHLQQLRLQVLDEVARHLSPTNAHIITRIRYNAPAENPLYGFKWLLLAAESHARLRFGPLKILTYQSQRDPVNEALVRLAQARDIEPSNSEECQQVVQQLRQYPAETLKHLLPVASGAAGMLCEALGWQAIAPLLQYIARQKSFKTEDQQQVDENDITVNMLDLTSIRALFAQMSETLLCEVLALFREANDEQILLEAVGGWNRKRIEKSLRHNMLLAIEAYGLLPLRDQDDLFERYQVLQEKYKIHTKFGPIRRVSHRHAVQRALMYLAQVAGYADVTLLELAMEARASEEVARDGRTWVVGEYTLQLHHDGLAINLLIARNGRMLKSIPAAVQKSAEYKEAQELVKVLRDQASRLRKQLFEKLLSTGAELSLDHLNLVMRVSTARAMLERLILCTEDGVLGLFDTEAFALRALDGSLYPVTSPVRVAHPYDLYQMGVLGDWQREIVRRRIVQPVKQVFRELYLLTPAERQSRTISLRFANRQIDDRIASRLFGMRQWHTERDWSSVTPYKPFSGMRALFSLQGTSYYLGAMGTVTTDSIYFERYPTSPDSQSLQDRLIPLEEVPPLIFSEVMRDADLIVSVAQVQQGSQILLSDEAYEKRGELVKTLLADLGLEGVEVSGHFAYVQGQLARYRVHLGSASIHIEPGNYLCIVPTGWGQKREQLFLPFIDEDDSKISEIISKIFLLLTDDQIKDESILRQIHAHTA